MRKILTTIGTAAVLTTAIGCYLIANNQNVFANIAEAGAELFSTEEYEATESGTLAEASAPTDSNPSDIEKSSTSDDDAIVVVPIETETEASESVSEDNADSNEPYRAVNDPNLVIYGLDTSATAVNVFHTIEPSLFVRGNSTTVARAAELINDYIYDNESEASELTDDTDIKEYYEYYGESGKLSFSITVFNSGNHARINTSDGESHDYIIEAQSGAHCYPVFSL
ncbi:MAG: hypothetical protein K6G84_11405 [Lachnospiraceae bacterium]|nr:hypothetical protein [Lachnospiraceae bacterium]